MKKYILLTILQQTFDGSINDKTLKYECFKKWHWEWSKVLFFKQTL